MHLCGLPNGRFCVTTSHEPSFESVRSHLSQLESWPLSGPQFKAPSDPMSG
jgi:hypothetical protein